MTEWAYISFLRQKSTTFSINKLSTGNNLSVCVFYKDLHIQRATTWVIVESSTENISSCKACNLEFFRRLHLFSLKKLAFWDFSQLWFHFLASRKLPALMAYQLRFSKRIKELFARIELLYTQWSCII